MFLVLSEGQNFIPHHTTGLCRGQSKIVDAVLGLGVRTEIHGRSKDEDVEQLYIATGRAVPAEVRSISLTHLRRILKLHLEFKRYRGPVDLAPYQANQQFRFPFNGKIWKWKASVLLPVVMDANDVPSCPLFAQVGQEKDFTRLCPQQWNAALYRITAPDPDHVLHISPGSYPYAAGRSAFIELETQGQVCLRQN
jgi:hypothetical protein